MNDYHEIVLVNKVEGYLWRIKILPFLLCLCNTGVHALLWIIIIGKKKSSVYKMHTSPQESGLVYPDFDFENLMNF